MMLEKKAPYAQKNWLKTIRGLMLFAIKENDRAEDATAGVTGARPIIKRHGHKTWGEEQIAVYRHKHTIGTMARLAIEMVLNIAERRGDVCTYLVCSISSAVGLSGVKVNGRC